MRPGFVTGLIFEADILKKAVAGRPILTHCASGSLLQAEEGALKLINQGADFIVSFGLAGALAPDLKSGNLVIAERVAMENQRPLACNRHFSKDRELGGTILSSPQAITTVEDKARLYQKTGAIAVDMESYGAALAAEKQNIPFATIRAIADPANCAIPKAAMAGMGDDGSLKIGAVLLELMKRPQDLTALIRLGADTREAKASLSRAARLFFG